MADDAFAATLDPRQAPAGDALAARPSDPLAADYSRTMNDIRGSIAGQQRTMEQREQALAPLRQQQLQQLRQPMPQPPQAQAAPPVPQRNEPGADEAWLMAASVLGAIAGGLTRNHTTNALAAATGAMEGWNEGNRQKFDMEMKRWNAENTKVLESNKAANDRYVQILNSQKLALEQKSQELQLTAAQFDDRAAMQLAQTKNFETLGRLIEQRMQHQERMQEQTTRLQQQAAAFRQREQQQQERLQLDRDKFEFQKSQGDQQSVDARAQAIAKYQLPPIANPRQPADRAVMNRVLELNPDYDAKRYVGETAGARSTGTRLANMENISYKLASVVPDALAASDAVARGRWVPVNQAIQMIQSGTSNPALEAFKTQNMNLAELWARAQKPTGVLDVALQQRAIEILSTAKSPEAYRTIVGQIVREIQREMQATKDQQAGKPLEVPEVPGAFVPPGQKPMGGAPQSSGNMLEQVRSKLPAGWTAEPVQ
jgi:hypothetical protein